MNSLLLKLNTKIANWESSGIGHNTLSTQDIISAIPNTISGQLLSYVAQERIPDRKLIAVIKSKCIKRYNLQITRKTRYYPNTKRLDSVDLNKLVHMAITEIITETKYTKKQFAIELCEKETTAYNNFFPIYQDFICLINDGLYRARRKFQHNIG